MGGSILAQTKKQFPQHTNWPVEQHEEAWEKAFEGKRPSIVYLTADASEQIDTLDKDSLYVVGGIVDRNRYPQLCLKKAQELGVRTAKLPIGEYLKLTGSKVCIHLCFQHILLGCVVMPVEVRLGQCIVNMNHCVMHAVHEHREVLASLRLLCAMNACVRGVPLTICCTVSGK